MPLEHFIIYIHCCVVDNYNELTKSKPLRKYGYYSKLSNSEFVTMEIVGECIDQTTD